MAQDDQSSPNVATAPSVEPDPTAPEVRRRPEPPAKPVSRLWILRHPLATLVLLVVLVGVAIGGFFLLGYFSSYESTDDAQIDGYIYPVSARISGRVTAVNFDLNQPVQAGQVLIQLDPTDYQVALQRTQAELAQAQATAQAALTQVPITSTSTSSTLAATEAGVQDAQAGISVAQQQYAAAQARIKEAEANYVRAQKDVERYRPLVDKMEISRQQFDQAVASADALKATLDTQRANADAAQRQIGQANARLAQARAQVAATASAPQEIAGQRSRAQSAQGAADVARANTEMAKLNVQYTSVPAPVNGVIGQRNVQIGQQISAGQQLMSVVPLNDLWATANFKETQLQHMRIGQRAEVHVDATDQTLKAHVDSFPGATGARYSLLPPENATGNYVKVVQRLPVKLVFEANQEIRMLRPGMSVEAKVWVK